MGMVAKKLVPDSDGRVMVQLRLDHEVVQVVDHYCVDHALFRAGAIEHLIRVGLEHEAKKKETTG